jgi:hypothetical protein
MLRRIFIAFFDESLSAFLTYFDVADVEFRCCRHVMLGVVSRGRGEGPDVGCARDTGHNMLTT